MSFWTQSAISAFLLAVFIIASIMLLTLRRGAPIAHACFFVLLTAYAFLPGAFWLLPYGLGASIAGASGVANLGTGVLLFWPVPYLYPAISTACVVIAGNRLGMLRSNRASEVAG